MPATDAHKKAMADAKAAAGATLSLHSTPGPGTTGANELSGGAYAKKTTTWPASVIVGADAIATGSTAQFDVPASGAPTHFGVWNGSTYLWGAALDTSVTFTTAGKLDVTPKAKYSET